MTKQPDDITVLLSKLESYRTIFSESSLKMIQAGNCALYNIDLLFCAVAKRAISLVEGFLTLAKENNYLCALPLVRLQLDNGLRSYALSFVKDKEDFFKHFASGVPIKKYKSTDGKNLSDNYLVSQMDQKLPGVKKLYEETSNYIHLSDQHLWLIKHNRHNAGDMEISVGSTDFLEEEKAHFISVMIDVSRIVHILIEDWHKIKIEIYKKYSSTHP